MSCSNDRELAYIVKIISEKLFTVEILKRPLAVPQCLHEPHLSHNVSMSMAGGQVQRRVVSAVHDINTSSSHDEHVHHAGAAFPACPVERAEAVVISTAKREQSHSIQAPQKPSVQQGLKRTADQPEQVIVSDLKEGKVYQKL